MARSVEAARGFYVRQRDQGFIDSIPTQSVGITQLKDEVRFGLMPIGTIFPVMANISGAYNPPPSGVVQDGFMRADGAAIPSGMALSGSVPDMTGSRFLMGTNGSGAGNNPLSGASGGNANNMKTLAVPELPGHTHPAGTYNAPHNHTGTVSIPLDNALHGHPSVSASGSAATANAAHNHIVFSASGSDGGPDVLATNYRTMNTSGPPGETGGSLAPHSHPSVTVFGAAAAANAPHQHPGSTISVATNPSVPLTGTSGSQGSGDSFSILPQYVATVYLIRVK